MWLANKKKVRHYGLEFVVKVISDQLIRLKNIKYHTMFADNGENVQNTISAIETKEYELVPNTKNTKWDSDFIFLVSCEFDNQRLILLYRQPYEYLYDNTDLLFKHLINEGEYNDLCDTLKPFSTYIFEDQKLIKAFTDKGYDLFDRYDFSKLPPFSPSK